jgi:hypothetical protein
LSKFSKKLLDAMQLHVMIEDFVIIVELEGDMAKLSVAPTE